MIELYTFQASGHDITKRHLPLPDYQPNGMFYEIARFLAWESWVWCFERMTDFDNDYFRPLEEWAQGYSLWRLSVPPQFVRWCGLDVQCTNQLPCEQWFKDYPEGIRVSGDIPIGLVKAPVKEEWLIEAPSFLTKLKEDRSEDEKIYMPGFAEH